MTEYKPRLGLLYINPAGGCNLHCSHCWVNEGTFSTDLLSLENWKNLLSEAASMGCGFLKMTGGEPLLYERFVELYSYAATIIGDIVIETNGTLQPAELWETFKKKKPLRVSVSIDNSSADIHDNFRGKEGSWAKSVEFVSRLVENKICNQIIMSVSSTDRSQIIEMIKLTEQLKAGSLKINFIIPLGKSKMNSFTDNCSIKDILEFFSWFNKETPAWVLPPAPAAFMPPDILIHSGYCPVRNLMGVLPDGTFSLCGIAFSKKEMRWGKYPETSVEEAWKHSPIYGRIREAVPDNLEGICKFCLHKKTCIGKCIVNNIATGGSYTSPNDLCQLAYENGLFPPTRLMPVE